MQVLSEISRNLGLAFSLISVQCWIEIRVLSPCSNKIINRSVLEIQIKFVLCLYRVAHLVADYLILTSNLKLCFVMKSFSFDGTMNMMSIG